MANQKLNATITIGSALNKSVGRHFNVIRSGLDSVGKEIGEVTARQRELAKQRRILERQGESVEALDREYEDLGRTLDALRRKQERYERAAKASARVGREFGNMTREVGRAARTASVVIGAAAAAGFGIASSTASLGDDVAKTADKLGMGIEAYQELRYAAERSGVSVSTFDSSMVAMTKRLGEAAQGTGAARGALEKLGLSAETLIEMEPDAALGLIADRMQAIENPAERAAISAALFSRAGVGMVNMLRDGSEGLGRLREDAQATGYVLSEQAARDAEVFQDSLLNARLAVFGLKNIVGSALMPVVTKAMDDFFGFMVSNRDQVEAFADAAADGLARAVPVVGQVASGLADVGAKVASGTAKLADFVGGWENFGVIVGGVLASKAIWSIGRFVGSVFSLGRAMWALAPALPVVAGGIRAIGLAIAANPIGAAVAAIALGATLVIANWEKIKPKLQPVFDWMEETSGKVVAKWEKIKSKLQPVIERIGDKVDWLQAEVIAPFIDWMESAPGKIVAGWESVKSGLGAVLDWIGAKFDWVAGKIKPVIDGLTWLRDKGKAAGAAVGDVFRGDGAPSTGSAGRREARPQARAVGGSYRAGPVLVGERGPELRYENRAGFIAHNRQLERLASLSDRAGRGSAPAAPAPAPVTQNITIHAQGMSVQDLVRELDRLRQQEQQGALYDHATDYGQYGGVHG